MLLFSQPGSNLTTRRSYEELRDHGREAVEAGRLNEALGILEEALDLARERGDQNLIDLAVCNRGAVLISLERQQEVMSPLRQILVRNGDAKTCALAAYNLSRAHRANKEHKKSLFYARIARDRAHAVNWLVAESHNQIGNCLMHDSYFEKAAEEYQRGLKLLSDKPSAQRGMVMANLGYCLMMMGQPREGMRLSFRSLRLFRQFGGRLYEVWPQLDLCYAYLDLGRLRRAREHGQRALVISEEVGEAGTLKIALYLLGETERMACDLDAAWEYFTRLQRDFYPDSPQIAELMLAVGMRQLVHLRD